MKPLEPAASPYEKFRDLNNLALELFIAMLTLLPFLVLIYFYPRLPARIPEYLNLHGEVELWGRKSLFSVFRLPLMALDLQLLLIFMKYGSWQRYATRPNQDLNNSKSLRLICGLADWFGAMVAVKLFVSSLEVIFLTDERFRTLATATRAISWVSSILGVTGAGLYSYRLFRLQQKLATPTSKEPVDKVHVRARFFYYNPTSPLMFVDKHLFNFANKWVYVFLICLLWLPVFMFWPMLNP
jgi:uncharacterized membrane protein